MSQDSPQQVLSEQVAKVRALARSQLARFAKLQPEDCKEIYLFQEDQFCGVRFTLGAFQADWRVDDSVMILLRGGSPVDRIDIDESQEKRAA